MFNEALPRYVLLFLTTTTLVSSYCPKDKIHSIGYCAFRITCSGTIRGVSLPTECSNNANHSTVLHLTLTNAIERFDNELVDVELLKAVTNLKVSAEWKQTTLSFLSYMPSLTTLILSHNNIQRIDGDPFRELRILQNLNLSHNSLRDIEDLFLFDDQINNINVLSLSHNVIEELPGDAFTELTKLKYLDLSFNLISDLSEEPFLNLTNLETLLLNNNRIKDLNGAVNNLFHLKHLYLRGNQIENIDEESLKIIYHLETFDVSGNQLAKLRPIMFYRHWQKFDGACRILLSENHITTIPNSTMAERFSRLKDFAEQYSRYTRQLQHPVQVETELNLSKNEINKIEYNAFQSIEKLISLDVSVNKLNDFIVDSKDLANVKHLNISSNALTHLYVDSFISMVNLQSLDLSHNNLISIPDKTFTRNYNLKVVKLTFNKLAQLKNLHIETFHPNGGVLDVSNNGISCLNIAIGEGLRLTILILNSNKIIETSCVNLFYQNELKIVELKNNYIQKLNSSSLRLPLSLVSLDLSYNAISKIGPSTFHRTTHLKFLFLSHNKIRSIEYGTFNGLTSLVKLDLSHNNLRYLDAKALMDLKSLNTLSLGSNELHSLDYKRWLGHRYDLKVYLEDNSLSCEWLGEALKDYNNGYSRMRPTVMQHKIQPSKHTLEGIPCIPNDERFAKFSLRSNNVLADERLLVTNQKILEAVREQTYFLRTFMNQFNNDNHFEKFSMRRKI